MTRARVSVTTIAKQEPISQEPGLVAQTEPRTKAGGIPAEYFHVVQKLARDAVSKYRSDEKKSHLDFSLLGGAKADETKNFKNGTLPGVLIEFLLSHLKANTVIDFKGQNLTSMDLPLDRLPDNCTIDLKGNPLTHESVLDMLLSPRANGVRVILPDGFRDFLADGLGLGALLPPQNETGSNHPPATDDFLADLPDLKLSGFEKQRVVTNFLASAEGAQARHFHQVSKSTMEALLENALAGRPNFSDRLRAPLTKGETLFNVRSTTRLVLPLEPRQCSQFAEAYACGVTLMVMRHLREQKSRSPQRATAVDHSGTPAKKGGAKYDGMITFFKKVSGSGSGEAPEAKPGVTIQKDECASSPYAMKVAKDLFAEMLAHAAKNKGINSKSDIPSLLTHMLQGNLAKSSKLDAEGSKLVFKPHFIMWQPSHEEDRQEHEATR